MIITGYQGIGKSSLAKKNDKIIDLESSSFWKEEDGNRTRHDDWYVYYCQVAQHLSAQGYTVFVSCHQEVRDYLSVHNEEPFCAIFPHKSLESDWLEKLYNRYIMSNSEKDLRAYEHARCSYRQDIDKLRYECQYNIEYYQAVEIIDNIDYNLQDLVNKLEDAVKDRQTYLKNLFSKKNCIESPIQSPEEQERE